MLDLSENSKYTNNMFFTNERLKSQIVNVKKAIESESGQGLENTF